MASYRQLSKNNWQVNFEIGKDPITGSRKRTSKSGFKTKKEAISFASKYELELSKVFLSLYLADPFTNTLYPCSPSPPINVVGNTSP